MRMVNIPILCLYLNTHCIECFIPTLQNRMRIEENSPESGEVLIMDCLVCGLCGPHAHYFAPPHNVPLLGHTCFFTKLPYAKIQRTRNSSTGGLLLVDSLPGSRSRHLYTDHRSPVSTFATTSSINLPSTRLTLKHKIQQYPLTADIK